MQNNLFETITMQNLMNTLGANEIIIRFIHEHTEAILTHAESVGIREAVTQYLAHSDKLFPESFTLETVVSSIVDTANTFAAACDEEITMEAMQNKIGSSCAEMTDEQALQYLACLHTVLNHIGEIPPSANKEEWQQSISAEYEALIARGVNVSVEEHIEKLVCGLDENKVNTLFSFAADPELVDALKNGVSPADAVRIQHNRLSTDAAAIAALSAAIYRQALVEMTAFVPQNVNPGVLTAQVGAAVNTARILQAQATEEITPEEAEIKLGIIGRAFATALTFALELFFVVAECIALVELALLIENVILCSIVTSLMYLVFGILVWLQIECAENIYAAFVKLLTKGEALTISAVKKLTNSADSTHKQTAKNTVTA